MHKELENLEELAIVLMPGGEEGEENSGEGSGEGGGLEEG